MASYSSVKSGNWSDPEVWNSASYPQLDGDTIIGDFKIQPYRTYLPHIQTINRLVGRTIWGKELL